MSKISANRLKIKVDIAEAETDYSGFLWRYLYEEKQRLEKEKGVPLELVIEFGKRPQMFAKS